MDHGGPRNYRLLAEILASDLATDPEPLGLMQGAMTALGAQVTVNRLDPFAEPDLCLAHLATAGSAP